MPNNQQPNADDLQQALEAKETECSVLRSERDALVNVQSTLQVQIENLKLDQEIMQGKMEDLESSLLSATAATQTNQLVQCQPETNEKMTETLQEEKQSTEIPSNQNVFTWDSFMDPSSSVTQQSSDFFSQQNYQTATTLETSYR